METIVLQMCTDESCHNNVTLHVLTSTSNGAILCDSGGNIQVTPKDYLSCCFLLGGIDPLPVNGHLGRGDPVVKPTLEGRSLFFGDEEGVGSLATARQEPIDYAG